MKMLGCVAVLRKPTTGNTQNKLNPMKLNQYLKMAAVVGAACLTFGLTGCDKAEEAGGEAEKAVEEAGGAVEKAAEEVGKATKEAVKEGADAAKDAAKGAAGAATDAAKGAANKAAEKVGEAAEKVKEATKPE